MAEDRTTKPAEPKSEVKLPEPKRSGLLPASESGNPEVHQLLAQRQAHQMNAGLEPDAELEASRKDAKAKIDEIDEKLAELGYTAK